MRSRRTSLTLFLLVFALASLPAYAQKDKDKPNDPKAVYIVVLNREKGPEPDFDKGGGRFLARWGNRVVMELPAPALEAMVKHGRVKYVQHLMPGPVTGTSAASLGRAVSANTVRALTGGGSLQWTTGDYEYDGSSNIEKVGPDSSGYTRRFKYDELNRLTEAGLEAPSAAPGTYTNYARYTYDSFGNRTRETTPTMDQILVANKDTNRVTMAGATVTYDGVGNMTEGGGFFYTYDPFNNLKEVDGGGVAQKMAMYNASDERIIFCGDGSVGPCRWTLRGMGNEVLREYESGPIGNGNYWAYYLWVEDSVYRGSLLAGAQREAAEGGKLHFHLDHLGSPRLTTNATGQKVTANEFAPFGRELTSITQEAQLGYDRTETHRFTGHERDFVEGTYADTVNFIDYMHARTYLPTFGRFLSIDPIVPTAAAGEPQRWNRYAYGANNPILNADPTGKFLQVRSSECDEDTTKCYNYVDAFKKLKEWVGPEAGFWLKLGEGGYVGLKGGMTVEQFSQFGTAATFLGVLISSSKSVAGLTLSSNVKDDRGNPTPAYTRPDANGTSTEINPAMLKNLVVGGVRQTMNTTLAHELGGHAMMPMVSVKVFDKSYSRSFGQMIPTFANPLPVLGEAFGISMENLYRAEQGLDIRQYYLWEGDYSPPRRW